MFNRRRIFRTIAILIILTCLFIIPVAADITGGSVENCNIYGSSGSNTFSPSGTPSGGATSDNITNTNGVYIKADKLLATYDSTTGNVTYTIQIQKTDGTYTNGYEGASVKTGTTGTSCGLTWKLNYTKDGSTISTPATTSQFDTNGVLTLHWSDYVSSIGKFTTQLTIENDSGSKTLISEEFTVGSSAPHVTSIDATPDYGNNTNSFNLVAVQENGTIYQWAYSTDGINFTDISGATTATYNWTPSVITPQISQNSIPLYVKFTTKNASGSEDSKSEQLMTLYAKPVITANTIPSSTVINTDISLIATIASSSDDIFTTKTWEKSTDGTTWNAITTSTTSPYTATFNESSAGTYYLRFHTESYGGNITTSSHTIVVTNAPSITATINGTTTVNGGVTNTVTLKATPNDYAYTWQEKINSSGTWNNISPTGAEITHNISGDTNLTTHYFRAYNSTTLEYSNEVTYIAHPTTVITSANITPTTGGLTETISATATVKDDDYTSCQWQYSTDNGSSWKNIGNANELNTTLNLNLSSTGTVKFRINVSNSYISSNVSLESTNSYTAYNKPVFYPSVSPSYGKLNTTFTLNSNIKSSFETVSWEIQKTTESTWTNIGNKAVITWTPTTSSQLGVYNVRVSVTNSEGISEVKTLNDAISVYDNISGIITVNPSTGLLIRTVDLDATISNPNNIQLSCQFQTSPKETGGTWTDIGNPTVSSNSTILMNESYNLSFKNAGYQYFRVLITIVDTTIQSSTNVASYLAMANPTIENITPTSTTTSEKIVISADVTGYTTGTYKYQYSTDGSTNWTDMDSPKGIINSNKISGSALFTTSGTYYIRLVVTYGENEIYSNTYSTPVTVTESLQPTLKISQTGTSTYDTVYQAEVTSGTPTNVDLQFNLNITTNVANIRLERATNTGTYSTIDTQSVTTAYTWTNQTISITTSGESQYFRVALLDSSNNVLAYSNTVGCVCYLSTQPEFDDSGISSSDTEEYEIPMKATNFPSEIVDIYAADTQYVVVVTHTGVYVIDGTEETYTSQAPLTNFRLFGEGYVTECKFYNNYLVCKTLNGEVFIVYVPLSGSNSTIFIGYFNSNPDNIIIDLNSNYVMVANKGTTTSYTSNKPNEVRTYTVIDGELNAIFDGGSNNVFAMTQMTLDSQLAYAILMGNTSDKTLDYTTNNGNSGSVELNDYSIAINTLAEESSRFVVQCSSSTAVVNYSLGMESNVTKFTFNSINYSDKSLSETTANYTGTVIGGINGNTIYFIDSNGTTNGTYPTSIQTTDLSIAKSAGNYSIAGTARGQISLISRASGQWAGIQNYAIDSATQSVSMSFDAHLIASSTKATVYIGTHVRGPGGDDENVLQTKYYAQITVTNADGTTAPKTMVTVTSPTAANTYTTDSYGNVVIEVVPTYTYTLSLPQYDDLSVTLSANNYALQYWFIQIPAETSPTAGATYSAKLVENSTIVLDFSDTNQNNKYDVQWNIYDPDDMTTILMSIYDIYYPLSTITEQQTCHHDLIILNEDKLKDHDTFIVKMEATLDSTTSESIKSQWSFTTEVDNTGDRETRDPLPDATMPVFPIDLSDKWIQVFICGLILMLGGLAGYAHSYKMCVLLGLLGVALKWMGIITMSWVWVIVIAILGFLAVYSYVSQNEGN